MKLLINTLHKGRPFGAIFVVMVALIGIFAQPPAALCASDLIVTVVDSSSVISDCQTLTADGTVSATVRNIGAFGTLADFDVIFFEDANENGRFDPSADNVLGSATQSALAADEIVTVSWKRVRCHILISALADIWLRRYIEKTCQGHGELSLKIQFPVPIFRSFPKTT